MLIKCSITGPVEQANADYDVRPPSWEKSQTFKGEVARGDLGVVPAQTDAMYYHDEFAAKVDREHDTGTKPFLSTEPRLAAGRQANEGGAALEPSWEKRATIEPAVARLGELKNEQILILKPI